MKRSSLLFLPLVILALGACDHPTGPDPSADSQTFKRASGSAGYQITELGDWDYMEAGGINNRGQVVGWGHTSEFEDHAFLWARDRLTDLFDSSGWFGQPFDINERQQIVGLSFVTWEAVLWENGQLKDLEGLHSAESINNRGQIAGRQVGVPYRAAVWEDGRVQSLGSLGGWGSHAFGINNNGVVVGFSDVAGPCVPESGWYGCTADHAFLWRQGTPLIDLGTLGGLHSYARAINESKQVVGRSSVVPDAAYPYHAFLWAKGQMEDLGTLGGEYSYAHGINSRGQVVGWAATESGMSHAFLWHKGRMVDLGCLPGGAYCEAHAVNDRGQIVGTSDNGSGEVRLVMWSQ